MGYVCFIFTRRLGFKAHNWKMVYNMFIFIDEVISCITPEIVIVFFLYFLSCLLGGQNIVASS